MPGHDNSANWFRSYGNENWEFGPDRLMTSRYVSVNDRPIQESERKLRWPLRRRPDDHPDLSELAGSGARNGRLNSASPKAVPQAAAM